MQHQRLAAPVSTRLSFFSFVFPLFFIHSLDGLDLAHCLVFFPGSVHKLSFFFVFFSCPGQFSGVQTRPLSGARALTPPICVPVRVCKGERKRQQHPPQPNPFHRYAAFKYAMILLVFFSTWFFSNRFLLQPEREQPLVWSAAPT